jgi:hypothetical protein
MLDIDFLALEYDGGRAVALVEYKSQHAKPQDPKHPSIRALVDLGDHAQKPVFAVRYSDDLSTFRVVPLNYIARDILAERTLMSELEYVTFLYRLRGRPVPPEVLTRICAEEAA